MNKGMISDSRLLPSPLETVTSEDRDKIRAIVRKAYGLAAGMQAATRMLSRNCSPSDPTKPVNTACCNTNGLGCGDPTDLAALQPGETVLDLGSGPGFDCFVAALHVGKRGRVVGIDFTPEMAQLARRNAAEAGVMTVSFVLGDIERLPTLDEVFDVVISNCVINLCPDKTRVLTEAHRVLRRGGRLAVSDIVALAPLPREIVNDLALHAGCVAGAATVDEMSMALHESGFNSVRIDIREESNKLINAWAPDCGFERFVAAANITATKY